MRGASEFLPKNLMISDFGPKKLLKSGKVRLMGLRIREKKLIHLVNASRRVLIVIDC